MDCRGARSLSYARPSHFIKPLLTNVPRRGAALLSRLVRFGTDVPETAHGLRPRSGVYPPRSVVRFAYLRVAHVHDCLLNRATSAERKRRTYCEPCGLQSLSRHLREFGANLCEPPSRRLMRYARSRSYPNFGLKLAPFVLDLACLTEGRRRCAPSRSYPCNSRRDFLPLALRAIPRGTTKSRLGCPPRCYGPYGVQVDRLRSVASHRGRDRRGPNN